MPTSAEQSRAPDHESAPELQRMLGDSRTVACGILLSRITGFGRIAAAAAVLGPTFFGNLFQITAVLPSSLYGLLIGSLISAVLVPPLVRRMSEEGREEVQRFAANSLGAMLIFLLLIAVLAMLAAPALIRAITVTVTDAEVRREQVRLGVPLLIMLMPQVALYGIAGVGMAVQQAHGRFALPAAAPALENLINIAVLGTTALLFGVGTDVDQIQTSQLLLLALGTTAAVAVHAGVQWIGAYRVGVRLWPRLAWHDPDLQEILSRAASSIGYTSFNWAAYLVMLVVGGTVPGGVAAFQIATSFCVFPVALAAVPLASAQLPRLSANQRRREMKVFGTVYENGLRLLIFIATPAGVIMAFFPQLLASMAAFGAMNSSSGIALIAACLGGLAMGVIGEATFVFTASACYAFHDTRSPVSAAALRLAVGGTLGAVAWLAIPGGRELMFSLGSAMAVANLVAGVYLCRRLRSGLPPTVVESSGFANALTVSIIAAIPAVLLINRFDGSARHLLRYERIGLALGLLSLTMVMYLVIQFMRGSRELRILLPAIGGHWMVRPKGAGM